MLKLTEEQLDWLVERIPKPRRRPKGGRPPADPRQVVRGIFWILDNGANVEGSPEAVRIEEHRSSVVSEMGQGRGVRDDHA